MSLFNISETNILYHFLFGSTTGVNNKRIAYVEVKINGNKDFKPCVLKLHYEISVFSAQLRFMTFMYIQIENKSFIKYEWQYWSFILSFFSFFLLF